MSNPAIWYLENINLLDILCPRKQAQQPPAFSSYKAGEYISISKDQADQIFYLNSGKIKIGTQESSGKEITAVILYKGEVFGRSTTTVERKRKDFIACITDCSVGSVSLAEFKALFRDYHAIKRFFLKIAGSRRMEMQDRLSSLVFRDTGARLASLLLEIAKRKGQQSPGAEWLIKDFIPLNEIAEKIAGSRQRVMAGLNELRKENVIAFSEKRLLIKDINRLEKYAKGNERAD